MIICALRSPGHREVLKQSQVTDVRGKSAKVDALLFLFYQHNVKIRV